MSFQPTRPRGARLPGDVVPSHLGRGFNPRAREGRDDQVLRDREGLAAVSTHAPARGATAPPWCHPPFEPCFNPRAREGRDDPKGRSPTIPGGVSTHAPARGATAVPSWPCQRQPGFNPRAREGRDGPEHHGLPGGLHVSTHAPARGATGGFRSIRLSAMFQPTRPRGARLPHVPCARLAYRVSTHAPARGATASLTGDSTRGPRSFNPRAREGRDGERAEDDFYWCRVSTHAPARGATVGFRPSHATTR